MSLEGARRQMPRQLGLPWGPRGEAPGASRSGEASAAANGDGRSGTDHLMEEVVESNNAKEALKRVKQNKGSPGIDGMTVDELPKYLKEHWLETREQLLGGTYQPKPVRRHEIPKSGGGVRVLGIPCVLDRFIQQAILQVLQPRFDPTFSPHSYGCRPGRGAHDALRAAKQYIQEGRRWVVDLDLEKFFDRVNHDVMMGRLERRIADARMLGLIRRYLEAGMMAHGVVAERREGTPQGGPLSPLLANVLLDEVDKEMEKRGHAFCRYVDDCNVYMRSKRAAERVMAALRRIYVGLRLRVNESKSTVARPEERKFLGYSFFIEADQVRLRVAPQSLKKMKDRVREISRRNGGRSLRSVIDELRRYLPGWKEYFRLTEEPRLFHQLDAWIRRRLRMVQLKQWKRGPTAFRKLRSRGVPKRMAAQAAAHLRRWWRIAGHPGPQKGMPNAYFARLGLPTLEG